MVRVGFMPNLELTWLDSVVKISTCCDQSGWSDWVCRSFNRCWVDRSGLKIWKTMIIRPRKDEKGRNPPRKFWKTAEIRRDLARSNEISTILARSRLDLPEKIQKFARSTTSHRKNWWVGRFRFLGFERRPDIWPADVSFWRKKSVASCWSSWFGRRGVRFGWQQLWVEFLDNPS